MFSISRLLVRSTQSRCQIPTDRAWQLHAIGRQYLTRNGKMFSRETSGPQMNSHKTLLSCAVFRGSRASGCDVDSLSLIGLRPSYRFLKCSKTPLGHCSGKERKTGHVSSNPSSGDWARFFRLGFF